MNIVIEQTGRIVQYVTIYLADGHDDLQNVTRGMLECDAKSDCEGKGPPGKLYTY